MNRIVELQTQRNERSRTAWQVMKDHRSRVTGLLLAEAGLDKRLCVLGCGNCNDIDLALLASHYGQVDLLDIDAEAVERAIQLQLPEAPSNVVNVSPVDLTGCSEWMSQMSTADHLSDAQVQELFSRLSPASDQATQNHYDVVASVCLLSQLIETITFVLGEHHPQHLAAIQAVRAQHLRRLIDMLRPAGCCLLIIDFVSTETAPSLPLVSDEMLPAVVGQLIGEQNFFTGLNPNVLLHQLGHDNELSPRVSELGCSRPWLWDFAVKQFAVVALRFRRR